MKKIAVFIGVFGFLTASTAQNNFIPNLNPFPGNVAFGTPTSASPFHLFQLHGVYDYCVELQSIGQGPQLPSEGPEVNSTICYGQTSHFVMTNPVTGLGQYDGALFRMSELNLAIENQEGELIDFRTGGSRFRLDGPNKNAWFGSPSTALAGTHVAAVNVFPAYQANGLLIKTLGSNGVGITVKGGGDEQTAIQVFKGTTGARNFAVKANGFVFARKYTTTLANIPDYVFATDYDLMPLSDLRNYITENQHLPNIPSAKEYEETGVDLGELNRLLLEKVEELTLYTLQLEERMRKLEEEK